jgi:hypothetical protein
VGTGFSRKAQIKEAWGVRRLVRIAEGRARAFDSPEPPPAPLKLNGSGRSPIQPAREFLANKCKSRKAEGLALAFIYFSESGLFKGLRAKNYGNSTPVSGCVQTVSRAWRCSFPIRHVDA